MTDETLKLALEAAALVHRDLHRGGEPEAIFEDAVYNAESATDREANILDTDAGRSDVWFASWGTSVELKLDYCSEEMWNVTVTDGGNVVASAGASSVGSVRCDYCGKGYGDEFVGSVEFRCGVARVCPACLPEYPNP